jgi:hypothetical protein
MMNSKRAIFVMSILGLVALTVSAQGPPPAGRGAGQGDAVVAPPAIAVPGGGFGGGLGGGFGQAGPGGVYYPVGGELYGQRSEEMEMARQCDSLVRQLAKADVAEKDKIKTKLTEAIDKQFDARQKRHEAEITALENQVKKLKEMVQKRQENRKDIVSKRFEQLIRESEGLGW